MAEIFDAQRRRRIRGELSRHMTKDRVSASQISDVISKDATASGGTRVSADSVKRFLDMSAGKVGDERVAAIEKYLGMRQPARPARLMARDPFFQGLCKLYGVSAECMQESRRDLRGIFSFYTFSEEQPHSGPPYVVRGAISFLYHAKAGLSIKEEQRDGTETERWRGYFFECQNTCVVVAQRKSLLLPKFYIMRPGRHSREKGSRLVTTLKGRMLKVGSTGGLFSSTVYMRRDPEAFGECSLLPSNEVGRDVMRHLGPPPPQG